MTTREHNQTEILIIDDDTTFTYVLAQYLLVSDHFQDHRIALTAVTSGEEAIVAVREHTPDLFVLDMRLDNAWLTAFEFAAFARMFPELASVPIVILTGFPADEIHQDLRRHNLQLQAQGYDPIQVEAIIQKGSWELIEATFARAVGVTLPSSIPASAEQLTPAAETR